MIDIILVLLVIVLVSASFVNAGLEIALPSANTAQKMKPSDEIIKINKNGGVFLNTKKISLKDLEQTINTKSKETLFIIQTHKQTPFEFFVKLIDILKSQGKTNIAIATTDKN